MMDPIFITEIKPRLSSLHGVHWITASTWTCCALSY